MAKKMEMRHPKGMKKAPKAKSAEMLPKQEFKHEPSEIATHRTSPGRQNKKGASEVKKATTHGAKKMVPMVGKKAPKKK